MLAGNDTNDIPTGLREARKFLCEVLDLGVPTAAVSSELVNLELEGHIIRAPGGFLSLNATRPD